MSTLTAQLSALLEDVDTAPEGVPLEDALDALTDFVQVQRTDLLHGLRLTETTPDRVLLVTGPAPDHSLLHAYMRIVEEAERVTFVPAAVTRRGSAWVPQPVPEHMTETAFQDLLEAEAAMMERSDREDMGNTLRTDLKRRRTALENQERRDRQIAALAPLPGRKVWGTSSVP